MIKQKYSYLNSYYSNIGVFFNESTKLCAKAAYSFLSLFGLYFTLMIDSLFVPQKIEGINALTALIIILSLFLLCGMVIAIYGGKTNNYNYYFATNVGLQTSEFSKINHCLKEILKTSLNYKIKSELLERIENRYVKIKNCSNVNVIQMLENSYKDEITIEVVEQESEILNKIIQLKELVKTDLSKNLTQNEKQKISNMNSTSNFDEYFFEKIIAKI